MPAEEGLPYWRTRSMYQSNVTTPAPTVTAPTPSETGSKTGSETGCKTVILKHNKYGALKQATCTFYDSFTTVTDYIDCGGCTLDTLAFGPGPVSSGGRGKSSSCSSFAFPLNLRGAKMWKKISTSTRLRCARPTSPLGMGVHLC